MADAVALAMVEALPTVAPNVAWQTIGTQQAPTGGAAVSTDGTRIYAAYGSSYGPVIRVINPATGVEIIGPSTASGQRQGVAGAWCNGRHYAIGGQNNSGVGVGTVEAYTPAGANGASGVWSIMAERSPGIGYSSAAVIGNFIYEAGGQGTSVPTASAGLQRYDTVNNTWTQLASMPAARTQGAMVAVGSKLYYLGGNDASGTGQTTVFVFDTTAGTWTTGPALGEFVVAAGVAVSGNTVYFVGGQAGNNTNPYATYRVTDGAWTLVTYPLSSHGTYPGAVTVGGSVYIVSGSGSPNVDKLDLGGGTGYTTAVLGVKSLLNPLLAGVAGGLPTTPPTDTTGRAVYAQTVQTLRALAAITQGA